MKWQSSPLQLLCLTAASFVGLEALVAPPVAKAVPGPVLWAAAAVGSASGVVEFLFGTSMGGLSLRTASYTHTFSTISLACLLFLAGRHSHMARQHGEAIWRVGRHIF